MDNLDEYIKYFKSLSLKEKQSIILDELKMIMGLTNQMCKEIGTNNEILLNNYNYTEDDFSEAVITYICSIKNSLCDFNDKLTEISDNME